MKRMWLALCLVFLLSAVLPAEAEQLVLASTSSADNTGLLDVLAPAFEKATGIELKWTPMASGKALALGRECAVDALLVHSPAAEKRYVQDGFGLDRTQIMYDHFVIIGPRSDPAGIRGKTVPAALKAIWRAGALFVSRGDDSGTHNKERSLWGAADLPVPEDRPWYVHSGRGMLETIVMAGEKGAYTITGCGTYIKYEADHNGQPPLVVLVENDNVLINQYSVMAVNPERCPAARYDLAKKFIAWMASPEARKLIGDFQFMGRQVFFPNAGQ
ncbi:MAG: substrate-binding domain-containing protein [Desulfovibrionaceae bacterium]|nr:substrate-binding domain-containing protein [Desulfovibrionaceae bacterium]